MRAICQIVSHADLTVDGKEISNIDRGLLVYIGFSVNDTEKSIEKALKKICGLRVFSDDNGKLNLSVTDIGGQILLVSNFTLYGDCSRGYRPSFIESAGFEYAKPLYEFSLEYMKNHGITVKPGVFGGDMKIESLADGPINIIIDSEAL